MIGMATDPNDIPQHVVDAALAADAQASEDGGVDPARASIAAALTALMDDEPVHTYIDVDRYKGLLGMVRPSDVLAAVLKRERER